jgi:hypothetical protein
MATIGTLVASLQLESAAFVNNLNAAASAMQKSARQMEQQTTMMQRGFGKVEGAVSTLRSGLATLGVGFSVAAVSGFVKSTFAAADALQAASQAAGVSAENLQRWRFAAEQSGGTADLMDRAIQKLNQNLGDFAISGEGPAAAAFETLGIAGRIAAGELSGTADVLDAAIAALVALEDPAKQAAIAADLFGREAGPRLRGLLAEGVEGIEALRASTAVLSNEQVARADEIGDAWDRVSTQITTRLQSVTLNLADAFARGAETNQRVAASYEAAGARILAAVQSTVAGIEDWMGSRLTAALEAAYAPIEAVTGAFERMYNLVVGRSYVPDMVDDIEHHFGRLDAAMVAPTEAATTDTTRAFETAADSIGDAFVKTFDQILTRGEDVLSSIGQSAQALAVNLGTSLGALLPIPGGAAIGGIAAIGASFGLSQLFGGLFGGGPSGHQITAGSGLLGNAGRGGTNEASVFLRGLDQQILGLLTERQTRIANRFLDDARRISVQFGDEGPSANDLSRLAARRIAPTAQALGFRTGAIAGHGRTPEQQLALLNEAIQLRRTIEDITGAVTPFRRAITDLRTQFAEMKARAKEFGISTEGMSKALKEAEEAIREQRRAEENALALSVTDPFKNLLAPLDAFTRDLELSQLNPAALFERAQKDFRDIARRAAAGDLDAILQFEDAARFFIEQAGRSGASPAVADAIREVTAANEGIKDEVREAERKASKGIEDAIGRAERSQVDKLDELVGEVRKLARELSQSRKR